MNILRHFTGNNYYASQGKDIGMLPDVARLLKTVGFPAASGLVPAPIPTPILVRMNGPEGEPDNLRV